MFFYSQESVKKSHYLYVVCQTRGRLDITTFAWSFWHTAVRIPSTDIRNDSSEKCEEKLHGLEVAEIGVEVTGLIQARFQVYMRKGESNMSIKKRNK